MARLSGSGSSSVPVKRTRRDSIVSEDISEILDHFAKLSDQVVFRNDHGEVDFVATVAAIHKIIQKHFNETPFRNYPLLDHETGVKSLIKMENLQHFADVAVRRFSSILICSALENGKEITSETNFLFVPSRNPEISLYLQELVYLASHLGATSTIIVNTSDLSIHDLFCIDNIRINLPTVKFVFLESFDIPQAIQELKRTDSTVYVDGVNLKQKSLIGLATVAHEFYSQSTKTNKIIDTVVVPVRRSNFTVTSLSAVALYFRSLGVAVNVVAAEMVYPQSGSVFGDPFDESFLLNRSDELQPARVFSRWNTCTSDGFLTMDEVEKVIASFGVDPRNVSIDFHDSCSQAQFIEFYGSIRSKLIRLSKVAKYNGSLLDHVSLDTLVRQGLVHSTIPLQANTDCLMGWCSSLKYLKTHVSSKGAAALGSLYHLPLTPKDSESYVAVLVTGGTVEPFGVGLRLQKALELTGAIRTFEAVIPKDSVQVDIILRILAKLSVSVHDIRFLQGISGPKLNTQRVLITCICAIEGAFDTAIEELRQNNVVITNIKDRESFWIAPNRKTVNSYRAPSPITVTVVDSEVARLVEEVTEETHEALRNGEEGDEEVGIEKRDIDEITLDSIKQAHDRLTANDVIEPMFVSQSRGYSRLFNCEVHLLFDNLQRTGSFKVRGSANFALRNMEVNPAKVFVCSSAGNHAQGVAAIAQKLGVFAQIAVPTYAPESKIQSCRAMGANIVKIGSSLEESMRFAKEFVRRFNKRMPNGALLIHPFNQPSVIEGQGTLIHSFFEKYPDGLDTLLISVGGGGLISSIALYAKEWARRKGKNIRIVGVQAEKVSPLKDFLSTGQVRFIESQAGTIADGCNVKLPFANKIIKSCVDEFITVEENLITSTISHLLQNTRTLTEGAGSLALAALLFNKVAVRPGEKVGIVLCGSNLDLPTLQRAHNLGLRSMGKVLNCSIKIIDVAGQLARVSSVATRAGVDLRQIRHDRHTESSLWSECILRVELQSPSFAEQVKFLALLAEEGLEAIIDGREIVPNHEVVYADFDRAVKKLRSKKEEVLEFDKMKFLDNMSKIHGK
ncbi:hypothetical protein RCL1_006778 [Eukaryota sp. TZLM3-RCL]